MPNTLIHKPTNTIFQAHQSNKTKHRSSSGAVFPILKCVSWEGHIYPIATVMPPELGQVAAHGDHIFTVVRRAMDKETGQKRLWYCEIATKSCGFYALDDCSLVSDELIDGWVEAIALYQNFHKEDSADYQDFIRRVPEPIRDLCVVRSFNRILELLPTVKEDADGLF